jgi:hypothetical protein
MMEAGKMLYGGASIDESDRQVWQTISIHRFRVLRFNYFARNGVSKIADIAFAVAVNLFCWIDVVRNTVDFLTMQRRKNVHQLYPAISLQDFARTVVYHQRLSGFWFAGSG